MKVLYTIMLVAILAIAGWLAYSWKTYHPSEWSNGSCAVCDTLKTGNLQALKGSVTFKKSGTLIFKKKETNTPYTLLFCDATCGDRLRKWFEIMEGDPSKTRPIYNIEGKAIPGTQDFLVLDAVLIN